MEEIDRLTRLAYERSVSEWLAAEVIILQQQRCNRNSVAESATPDNIRRATTASASDKNASKGINSRSQSVSGRSEQTMEEVSLRHNVIKCWKNDAFKHYQQTA